MPVETPARPEIVHRDFYEVLGVPHHATEEAIRSAYRKLVRLSIYFGGCFLSL
jgi:DnaJ-domain-containing protein 1